ncbi:hypothetical protein ACFOY2_15270 [Nonomuraea purpurea]|uniref:Uncharacterized protein n=1 Tax=Nonomuraea purpurea TaxID=1849276 RepID=A0ABV8G663_9ACTN
MEPSRLVERVVVVLPPLVRLDEDGLLAELRHHAPRRSGNMSSQFTAAPVARLEPERHVQAGQELRLDRHVRGQFGNVSAQDAAAGTAEPRQHIQQAADRRKPVLVGDLVPVVSGTIPQPLDVAKGIDDVRAADVRLRAFDQIVQSLAAGVARDVVVPPQLLEYPLRDFAYQGDRVLRVTVAEGLDRALEVQAEIAGDPGVVIKLVPELDFRR